MNNKYLVSVIMCYYNTKASYLLDSIYSILNQTLSYFELILVDDGSDKIIYKLPHDKRIKVIKNPNNKGISYSRNKAITISSGKYIAIMDSDDIAEPTRLEKQYLYMEKNTYVVACGTWFKQFGQKNNVCKRIIDDNDYYRARLFFGNSPTLLDPSSFIRKDAILHIMYDERLIVGMDYLMWIKLSEIGIITNIKEVLMNYRVHSNQISKTNSKDKIENLWMIHKYQMNKLKIDHNDKTKSMLCLPLNSTIYSLKEYYSFLQDIVKHNVLSNYYKQEALEKVISEQWQRKILSIKRPLYLLKGFFNVKGQRLTIIKVFLRHFNPFLKNKVIT